MKTTRACSATKIGEFLGENKEFNKDVLFTYTDEFDFTDPNITFVDA
jgi:Sec7-like guanine-nucleotide exchange factor